MRIGKSNTDLKEYSLKPGIPSMEYSTAEKDVGNQNIFLEKNHNPPWKLNGPSLNVFISRYSNVQKNSERNKKP
jgi:hypothetical protein